jgi:hypothetical protein
MRHAKRTLLLSAFIAPFLLAACGRDDRPIVVNPQPTAVVPQPAPTAVVTPPAGGTVIVPPGTRVCPAGSYC